MVSLIGGYLPSRSIKETETREAAARALGVPPVYQPRYIPPVSYFYGDSRAFIRSGRKVIAECKIKSSVTSSVLSSEAHMSAQGCNVQRVATKGLNFPPRKGYFLIESNSDEGVRFVWDGDPIPHLKFEIVENNEIQISVLMDTRRIKLVPGRYFLYVDPKTNKIVTLQALMVSRRVQQEQRAILLRGLGEVRKVIIL